MNTKINEPKHFIHPSFGNLTFFRGIGTVQNFKPHFHECYTIILVDKGIADYSTNKSNFIVSPNTVLVINPYEIHTGRSVNNSPWSFLTLYIPIDIMKKVMKQERNCSIAPIFKNNKLVNKALFNEALQVFSSFIKHISVGTLETILMTFIRNLLNSSDYSTIEISCLSERYLIAKKIRDYIHQNPFKEHSLVALSKELNINEYNLIKIFKKFYNLPPNQYAINLKIEKAKQLLSKKYSCTEVAYQFGFFDQSHFIRHFKKITGITPKRYATIINNN